MVTLLPRAITQRMSCRSQIVAGFRKGWNEAIPEVVSGGSLRGYFNVDLMEACFVGAKRDDRYFDHGPGLSASAVCCGRTRRRLFQLVAGDTARGDFDGDTARAMCE